MSFLRPTRGGPLGPLALAGLFVSGATARALPATLNLVGDLRPRDLVQLVTARSPREPLRSLDVDLAQSQIVAARTFGNPSLDFGWNTLPIGPTNPRDLKNPIDHVPNYAVGVSYTFDWLKRRSRIASAEAELAASEQARIVDRADDVWGLARTIGRIAVAQLKQEAAREMRADAKRSVEVVKTRASAGASSLLDLDRMENEHLRAELEVRAADAELQTAAADCASFISEPCRPFASREDADRFLLAWVGLARDRGLQPKDAPMLHLLEARRGAANAALEAARALAIPEVTLRFGYLHDRFAQSGAQVNSLNIQLQVPIPVASYGRAERQAAASRQARVGNAIERLTASLQAQSSPLLATLEASEARLTRLDKEMLPRARSVKQALEQAAESRLLPITDVLQARRTLNELLRDRADSAGSAFQVAVTLLALGGLPEAP